MSTQVRHPPRSVEETINYDGSQVSVCAIALFQTKSIIFTWVGWVQHFLGVFLRNKPLLSFVEDRERKKLDLNQLLHIPMPLYIFCPLREKLFLIVFSWVRYINLDSNN
jgi:hypothetical protein